jgi:hypothetical protein
MQVNIVHFFQTLTTDTFIIYRVFVKMHILNTIDAYNLIIAYKRAW